jgi:uncharacterized protein (UPF0147 family)
MQDNQYIIEKLISSLRTVDYDKKVPYIVKDIDKHVQEAYSQLYKHREEKQVYKPLNDNKRGHCC